MTKPSNQPEIERWEQAVADMVVCYVLVRTDTPGLPSLGRMGAQLHHCGTQMTEEKNRKNFPDLNELYDEWQRDAVLELAAAKAMGTLDEAETLAEAAAAERHFGTVLTLAV